MFKKDDKEERIKKLAAMLKSGGSPPDKEALIAKEDQETPEEEALESPEEEEAEDKMGIEPKKGKLFGMPRQGMHVTISMKGRK